MQCSIPGCNRIVHPCYAIDGKCEDHFAESCAKNFIGGSNSRAARSEIAKVLVPELPAQHKTTRPILAHSEDDSDAAILAAIATKDASVVLAACQTFITRRVCHLIKREKRLETLREDISQDIALAITTACHNLFAKPHPNPIAYLLRTIKHSSLLSIRPLSVRRSTDSRPGRFDFAEMNLASEAWQELLQCCEVVKPSPQRAKEILEWKREGWTYKEIAARVGFRSRASVVRVLDAIEAEYRRRNDLPKPAGRRALNSRAIYKGYRRNLAKYKDD